MLHDVATMAPGRHQMTGTKGLYLYVTPDGDVRRFIYRYTSPATKRVTETGLGLWPTVALTDAKAKVSELRTMVAAGTCPITAKREARANVITFRQACDAWIATNQSAWKHGAEGSQMSNANVLLHQHGASLANKRVAEITPDHVQAALKTLWERSPLQGRRALNMWQRVFDFAKAKSWMQGQNPAQWQGLMQYRFPRQRKSDRVHYAAMDYTQTPEFMKALRQRQGRSTGALCLEFVILTACRAGEALGAEWRDIDFDKKLWTIPAEKTKQGRQHQVPLSDRALAILKLQRQYANGSEFIFTGYQKTRLADKAMVSVLRHMGLECSVHGMRSSFRDWAGNETLHAREHIEEALSHRVGSSVELAYRRQSALEKRRVILRDWEAYINGDASRAHDSREAA